MSGVGWLISKLSANISGDSEQKERVVLDRYGRKVETTRKANQPRKWVYHPQIVRANGINNNFEFFFSHLTGAFPVSIKFMVEIMSGMHQMVF